MTAPTIANVTTDRFLRPNPGKTGTLVLHFLPPERSFRADANLPGETPACDLSPYPAGGNGERGRDGRESGFPELTGVPDFLRGYLVRVEGRKVGKLTGALPPRPTL